MISCGTGGGDSLDQRPGTICRAKTPALASGSRELVQDPPLIFQAYPRTAQCPLLDFEFQPVQDSTAGSFHNNARLLVIGVLANMLACC